ncbi:plasmid mobilization protein, partial [Gilliamella sp. HK7]
MESNKARRNTTPIKVWVFPEEKEMIISNAKKHGLSTSSFLRQLGLNIEVRGIVDQQRILELVKINADLGRLGGLLKLWLTNDEKIKCFNKNTIDELLTKISIIQN